MMIILHNFLADDQLMMLHPVTVTSGSSNTLPIPTVADAVVEGTGGMITATIQPDPESGSSNGENNLSTRGN